ncbi:TPA: macro domain-containing protein [Vibrio vulnificus]|uniref:macro domain-containing protein n=2 Tax=Vibrio vulnificus TaxID=672 RepID=UPI00376D8C19
MNFDLGAIMRKTSILLKNSLMAFGIISSMVTVLWAIFPKDLPDFVAKCPWLIFGVLILISICYGLTTVRNKNKITLNLTPKVKAKIYDGDLLAQNGIIVIPVNDYFDTIVDNKIISENTLHGMFIKRFFGGDEKNLRSQITKVLSTVTPASVNTTRKTGNKKRYPLGTVVEVTKDERVFYLVALTRFNDNHRAEIKNTEYQQVLCSLFSYIHQFSQGRKVSLPLMGSGHSGVNLSKQKLLEFLLFSIAMNDNLTLIDGIDIILHSSNKNEINLTMTEILFNSIKD